MEKKKTKIVYAGVRIGTDKKIVHLYYRLDENEAHTNIQHVYGKKIHNGSVGCIVEVELSDDEKTITYSKGSYGVGFYSDNKIVSEWKASSDAIEESQRRKKNLIKEATKNPLHDRLDPIKEAYKGLNASERASLLANIIEYITR